MQTQPPRFGYDYRSPGEKREKDRERDIGVRGRAQGRPRNVPGEALSDEVMDGANGWRVANFSEGSHRTIINPMMLRFRPIAPKPAAGRSCPGGFSPENKNLFHPGKRVKRKYVRVQKNNNPRRKNRSSKEETRTGLDSASLTLKLMPEKSDGEDLQASGSCCFLNQTPAAVVQDNRDPQTPVRSSDSSIELKYTPDGADRTAAVPRSGPAVKSWVTVECVTEMCMDDVQLGLGCTDVDKINKLGRDTCPAFVSDGFDRVKWVNEAYKRMMVATGDNATAAAEEEPGEMVVWLMIKAKLPHSRPAFTCWVRLEYQQAKFKQQKEGKCSKIMPCDVWRMDFGGFAWRLDVKAALSLGL